MKFNWEHIYILIIRSSLVKKQWPFFFKKVSNRAAKEWTYYREDKKLSRRYDLIIGTADFLYVNTHYRARFLYITNSRIFWHQDMGT